MEPAAVISISLCAVLVAIAGFSIYTAFGPPSKDLLDPYEEHED